MPVEITNSTRQATGTSRKRLVIAFLAGMAFTAAAAQAPALAALLSPGPEPYTPLPVVPGLHQEIYPGTELVQTMPLPVAPA
jgi:hypothetical protein